MNIDECVTNTETEREKKAPACTDREAACQGLKRVCVYVCLSTHGPCGGLGGAGLLEGHLEGMRPRVVGVGGDCRGGGQALKGGVGLGVRRRGGHGRRRRVLGAVGAGGRGAAPQALHAAAQQVVLGLGGEAKREENQTGEKGREQEGRGRTQLEVRERQRFWKLKGGQVTEEEGDLCVHCV